jgi:dihydrolipoamide dehydrogenase
VVPTAEKAENQQPASSDTTDTHHFDIVVIGGGPAGYAGALYGASAGLRVAMIEKAKLGGTCLHVGCIPAKELLETAHVYRTVASAKEFGVETSAPTVDLSVTQARKQKVIDGLVNGLRGLLKGRKVTVLEGTGSLHAGRTVRVQGSDGSTTELTGDAVFLASGSVPRTLPGFDVDGTLVMTSDEFLSLADLPARAAVIGGGAIGCEFASYLADLGTQVTILEALPKILPGCDEDVTKVVERSFKKRGIEVRTGVRVTGHQPAERGTAIQIEGSEPLEVDVVVVSVGRRPASEGLGLDGTAVQVDERGYVVVDALGHTGEPGVWALGDLVSMPHLGGPHPQLAHVGFIEAITAVQDVLGEEPVAVDHAKVPWCIYCHPEVAFAGMTEAAAKEAGREVVTSKHRFAGNGRAMIVGDTEGLVKVIAEKRPDGTAGTILGVHMVGPWVTEQLGQGYLAVNWEATVDDVAQFIQPHPTMSELFGETVLSLTGRSLHG